MDSDSILLTVLEILAVGMKDSIEKSDGKEDRGCGNESGFGD